MNGSGPYHITFLGTGTSSGVPMIACPCSVCASPDARDKRLRSSVLVETASTTIVIDTTPDFRYQMLRAQVKKLDGIVFTHPHKDHIAGLDDVRAYNFFTKQPMHIYANEDYFRAFGFDNPDDLVGVPLLDLVDPDFADEFKARIKDYRGDGDQASFTFHGRTLAGVPFSGQMTLSAAEFEGERCTQVLLKCSAPVATAVQPAAAGPDAMQDVPILTSRADPDSDGDPD